MPDVDGGLGVNPVPVIVTVSPSESRFVVFDTVISGVAASAAKDIGADRAKTSVVGATAGSEAGSVAGFSPSSSLDAAVDSGVDSGVDSLVGSAVGSDVGSAVGPAVGSVAGCSVLCALVSALVSSAKDGEAAAVFTPAITRSAVRDAAITAFALGAEVMRNFTVCNAPGWGFS